MGSLSDTVTIITNMRTMSGDGTSRNNQYSFSTTLSNYLADTPNMATPLWSAIVAERSATGTTRTATPVTIGGMAGGGPVSLRFQINIGQQALATPTKSHLVVFGEMNDFDAASPMAVMNFLNNAIVKQIPINIYPGVAF